MFQSLFSNHFHQIPNAHSNSSYDIPNGHLSHGKQIFISGFIHPGCQRFEVNLESRNGKALHFNPRFDQNAVVRNTEAFGGWQNEEREGGFPFRHGGTFDIVISVEHDRYVIKVNGHHFCDYRHRTPINEVHRLALVGDIQIYRLAFSSGGSHGHAHECYHPALPFSTPIAQGAHHGRLIQISGHVPHHSGRFVVNVQNGPGVEPNDIPLHLSVRYNDPNTPHPVVVRTNRHYGNWGNEEREGVNPFYKGQHFDLLILFENQEFKIAVNGQHFTSFRHRNSLHEANHISISGDVEIHSVRQF